jgi:hypothetical protein
MHILPERFQDFCKFYNIYHYGNQQTYKNINYFWEPIYNKMRNKGLLFPSYDLFINYLREEYEKADNLHKFSYQYIINHFYDFQIKYEIFINNYNSYMNRLQIYSKIHKCKNIKELKCVLERFIKRIIIGNEKVNEDKLEFAIMARYICDYLECTPEDIPNNIFYQDSKDKISA